MSLNTKISIIGCGWLGFPLAKHLVDEGYTIKGSTTSIPKLDDLKSSNIDPYLIQLSEVKIEGDIEGLLLNSEIVIINIPPGLRKNPNKNHVNEIRHLIKHIETQNIKYVLYISSTSVYKNENSIPNITEEDLPNATSNNGQQLIAIEQMLQDNPNFETTILRFSGLLNSKRHPGQTLSGRTNLKNGEVPINLIHRDDCIKIISELIKYNLWNQVFNASNPYHPSKKSYYTNYCKTNHLPLPHFDITSQNEGKLIDSSKLVQLLNYEFKTAL